MAVSTPTRQQAEALARQIGKLGFACTIIPQTQPVSI
jgi:hypothetical protein